MATTLKMLVERARHYYQMMEANRRGITIVGLVTTPTTKLFVFDQLLEQYNTDPEFVRKYVYRDKKPDQTPDQVVAEIIEKDLTLGITEGEVEAMKVQIFTPSSGPTTIETFLKILDNCAKAVNRSLSIEQAKNNIAELSATYQAKMSTLDTKDELLTQANIFLDQQAVLIAHQEEIAELNRQHQKQLATATAAIALLYCKAADNAVEIDNLNADGEELFEASAGKFELYEAEIQLLKQQYQDLQASCEALKFRLTETNTNYQTQLGDSTELLTRYSELHESLIKETQAKAELESGLDSLTKEFGIVSQKLQTTTDFNMHLSTMSDELTALVQQTREKLEKSEQKLTIAKEEIAQLAPQVTELISQVAERDTELAAKDREIAAHKKARAAVTSQRDELQQSLTKSTITNTKIQEQYQTSIETVAERDQEIAGLRAEIEGLQLLVVQLENQTVHNQEPSAQDPYSSVENDNKSINGFSLGGQSTKQLHGANPELFLTSAEKKKQNRRTAQVVSLVTNQSGNKRT